MQYMGRCLCIQGDNADSGCVLYVEVDLQSTEFVGNKVSDVV